VSLIAKRATLSAPIVGPLRATVVFGGAAAGRSGACAVSAPLICRGSGRTQRCR
jgi:hypothetical protein